MIETTHYSGYEVISRLFWGWCWKYRVLISINFVTLILFSAINGAYAPIVKELVDSLSGGTFQEDVSAGYWIAGLILAATFAKAATLFAHKLINNRIFSRVSTDLQHDVFSHIVHSDIAWHGQEPAAARAARVVGDVGALRFMLERVVNNLFRDGFMVIAVFASMIYIDWELALITLLIFPIAILPIAKISQTMRKIGRQTQASAQALQAELHESLASIRIVKAYRLENTFTDRMGARFEQLRRLTVRAGDHSAIIDPLLELLGGIALLAVLGFIAWRVDSGVNTLGDIAGFVVALLLAAQPLRAFGNLAANIQHGIAAGQRVFTVLDEKAEIIDAPAATPLNLASGGKRGASIALDSVTFRYGEDVTALDNLSMEIPGGATVALVGRSGAGKSTIFNLIPRLYDPTSGAVRIQGRDLRDVTIASLRDQIALVTQEAVLFNDTVAANIAAGLAPGRAAPTEAEIVAAAEAASAHAFIRDLPNGYETVIGDRGERLSGGQRQRLSIARAFLRDAPILLLDEPTSALDSETEKAVKEALDRLSEGRTTVVIAHRLSTIMDADRIAVLEAGRLVETGDHAQLLARDGAYAALHKIQFAELGADAPAEAS